MSGFSKNAAVVGAGPSGIMAALQASQRGMRVTLFDHNDAIGRKLLVTGSGRCNLTNASVAPEAYYCTEPAWMRAFLAGFGVRELVAELDKLGIPTLRTDDGWYYPLSQSAHAVVEILLENLRNRNVNLQLATSVVAITQSKGRLSLQMHAKGRAWSEAFDQVVIAAGGRAYPELGSRGELFPSLQALGHSLKPLLPALGPIYAKLGDLQELQGQRFDVLASIHRGKQCLGESQGSVIITKDGFNGPGVMNLSHLVHLHLNDTLTLRVNLFAPHRAAFDNNKVHPAGHPASIRTLLLRALAPKVVDVLLRSANLDSQQPIGDKSSMERAQLLEQIASRVLAVTGAGSYKNSQVTVGGVPVIEVRPSTLESLLVPGLYLAGETLDVAGPCGGYNLHFAFGSGYLAGKHLAQIDER